MTATNAHLAALPDRRPEGWPRPIIDPNQHISFSDKKLVGLVGEAAADSSYSAKAAMRDQDGGKSNRKGYGKQSKSGKSNTISRNGFGGKSSGVGDAWSSAYACEPRA